jgi:hypothetical protein
MAGNRNLSPFIELTGGLIQDISVEFSIPDAYILCFSEHYLPEKMGDDFGKYCIEIQNPFFVMQEITKCIGNKFRLKRSMFNRVTYTGHEFPFNTQDSHEEGFLKSEFYADQDEVRMYWEIFGATELQPYIMNLPHLATYFRLMESH